MFTRIRLRAYEDRYVIDFDKFQWQLVTRVMRTVLDRVDGSASARLLTGVDRDEALSILDQAEPVGSREHMVITLSPQQLHILYATLTCACLGVRSEETFYNTNGFFLENVIGITAGLENALVGLEARGEPAVDTAG